MAKDRNISDFEFMLINLFCVALLTTPIWFCILVSYPIQTITVFSPIGGSLVIFAIVRWTNRPGKERPTDAT